MLAVFFRKASRLLPVVWFCTLARDGECVGEKLKKALADTGLSQTDPRLARMMSKLKKIQNDKISSYKSEDCYGIDLDTFKE